MYKEVKQTSDLDLKNQQLERENFTLRKDKSLLENKIKYNEHETHLKDLEIQGWKTLFKKEENLMARLEEKPFMNNKYKH